MEEEFVPYTEALAMKKLGFNEECIAKYAPYNASDPVLLYPETQNFFKGPTFNTQSNSNYPKGKLKVAAPLWQQAFRWFREKYDIHGEISVYYNPSKLDKVFYECNISSKDNSYDGVLRGAISRIQEDWGKDPNKYMLFNTYEEAQFACLQQLITICQQQSKASTTD